MTVHVVSQPCRSAHPRRAPLLPRLTALWRQRRDLARLDDRALEDIGLSRAQADAEARRPIWDAPDFWRR